MIALSRLFHVTCDHLLLGEDAPQGSAPAPESDADDRRKTRRALRLFFGKLALFAGLILLAGALLGAVAYAQEITAWYTSWGPYGTALFFTWLVVPLILGAVFTVLGGIILGREYCRKD